MSDFNFIAQQLINDFPIAEKKIINEDGAWVFDQTLKAQSLSLDLLLPQYMHLLTTHHVLCVVLNSKQYKHYDELKPYAVAGLMLTQLLNHIHIHARSSTQINQKEMDAVNHAQRMYKQFLSIPNHTNLIDVEATTSFDEQNRREWTQYLDYRRQLFIRGRRGIPLLSAMMSNFETLCAYMESIDSVLRVMALYQFVMLIPRLIENSLYLYQQPGHYLSHLNINERWWEMGYDFGWIAAGLLNVFVFIGPLAPLAAYVPVFLPAYHLILHITRLLIIDSRLDPKHYPYETSDNENNSEIAFFLAVLQERRDYNTTTLYIRIAANLALILAGTIMALNLMPPMLPFAGVLLTLLATYVPKEYSPKQKDTLDESALTINTTLQQSEHPKPSAYPHNFLATLGAENTKVSRQINCKLTSSNT